MLEGLIMVLHSYRTSVCLSRLVMKRVLASINVRMILSLYSHAMLRYSPVTTDWWQPPFSLCDPVSVWLGLCFYKCK